MEFVFLAILVATGIGMIIGEVVRRLAFRRLKKGRVQKPQYNIEDNLTPAEFGCIIDGKVGEYELLGELVQLHQKGVVRLARDSGGQITVVRTLNGTGDLAEMDKILLKALFRGPAKPVVLRDSLAMVNPKTIEYAKKEVMARTAFVMHTTQTFKEMWHLVHGVYIYLLISGNDIFTPDYDKLELEKMDALYPYAIAARVEKGLLRST